MSAFDLEVIDQRRANYHVTSVQYRFLNEIRQQPTAAAAAAVGPSDGQVVDIDLRRFDSYIVYVVNSFRPKRVTVAYQTYTASGPFLIQ